MSGIEPFAARADFRREAVSGAEFVPDTITGRLTGCRRGQVVARGLMMNF
jgi:hypothetical protein